MNQRFHAAYPAHLHKLRPVCSLVDLSFTRAQKGRTYDVFRSVIHWGESYKVL